MKKVILFLASRPSPPLSLFTSYSQGPPVAFFCKISRVIFRGCGFTSKTQKTRHLELSSPHWGREPLFASTPTRTPT